MVTDQIKSDLGHKLADDVSGAIKRTTSLLVTPQDRFLLALYATATAAGYASGFAQQAVPTVSIEEAVDDLWMILRPMVLMTAGGGSADFRALLRQAPKGDGTHKRKRRKP